MIPYINPGTDATSSLSDVCRWRRGDDAAHVRAAKAAVLARYDDYRLAAPLFATLTQSLFTDPQAPALRDSYRYRARAIKAIDAAARGAQPPALQNTCPLCGFGEPSTMDHALPKEPFPEFAVFPLNLIPACGKCNTDKGEEWTDAAGKRHLHAYLDTLPVEPFLFMDVLAITNGAPTLRFRVTPPAGTEPGLAARLQRHFQFMDLEARYLTKTVGTLAEYTHSAPRIRGRTQAVFRDEIETDRAKKAAVWGNNYWETVTLAGLRDSQLFLQHLEFLAR
jgi:hypothetical protein